MSTEDQQPIPDLDRWNEEDAEELQTSGDLSAYNIAIAARDWTVETIVHQIKQGNIDLDPAFQRRNAWRDQRRSLLIESFILGFPVPQIVLAEHPQKKKTFIVIDGKQRLLTIAGFFLPTFRDYWTQPRFSGLKVLEDLNRVSIDDFDKSKSFSNFRRQLVNADIRTTVLTGFSDEGVLYDIFYRINTGSVPLSSQELRQVLNRGPFARHLLDVTSNANPLWHALRITAPDPRLRDVELLLRLVAWRTSSSKYIGNMKPFLDDVMKDLNSAWSDSAQSTTSLVAELLEAVEAGISIFGENLGRKFKNGHFESALNRALFEVQVYYFSYPSVRAAAAKKRQRFITALQKLSQEPNFLKSIEATTKSIENYRVRFSKYRAMVEQVLGVRPPPLELGHGTN